MSSNCSLESFRALALLRHVAEHENLNIRQLAQELGRDYKNVHDDVSLLCQLGLIEKRDAGLVAPYDEIVMHYSLRQAT